MDSDDEFSTFITIAIIMFSVFLSIVACVACCACYRRQNRQAIYSSNYFFKSVIDNMSHFFKRSSGNRFVTIVSTSSRSNLQHFSSGRCNKRHKVHVLASTDKHFNALTTSFLQSSVWKF